MSLLSPTERRERPDRLAINYLLEDTALFGGAKVVLRQADLLWRRGHRVTVVAKAPRPDWHEVQSEFLEVPRLDDRRIPPADVTVATYWTTLGPAREASGAALHYCQGYEGLFTHNRAEHGAIERAYGEARGVPAMTVAPHLSKLIEARFRRPARVVAQPLEPHFEPDPARDAPGSPARVLVMGPRELDWKGVATSVAAVEALRRRRPVELVRVSQWEVSEEERREAPGEYHVLIPPPRVAALMRTVDLLLAASWEQEGFGLPVLEAMASGVPVVASDIESYRWFASSAAALVPFDDPSGFAAAADGLLRDPRRYLEARQAGLGVADRFQEDRAADEAESALRWAAGFRPARESP